MVRRSHASLLVVAVALVAAACGSSTHSASSVKKHTSSTNAVSVDNHDDQPAVIHDHCGSQHNRGFQYWRIEFGRCHQGASDRDNHHD